MTVKMTRKTWPMEWNGHRISPTQWGGTFEPVEQRTACSCGWQGTVWCNTWGPNIDAPLDQHRFTAAHQAEVIAAGGIRAWRGPDGERYGDLTDAIREALAHVGYDPDEHAAHVEAARTALVGALAAATGADPLAEAKQITALADAYERLRTQHRNLAPLHAHRPQTTTTTKEK